MAVSFPDDVLLEILFRVKDVVPAALFRCATACKRWRDLVAEPAFLRRCWPDQDVSSSMVGFFTRQLTRTGYYPAPFFTPMRPSALDRRTRALSSFMAATPAGVFDGAVPLVSRHGLLLVRLHTEAKRGSRKPIILDLAVCNLLTGTCHMLPALKFSSEYFDECKWTGYAILTSGDCRSNDEASVLPSNSSFFKVVIVKSYDKHDMGCSLHTFSSDEESWSVRIHCFDSTVQPFRYGPSSRAVVRRGMAHWLIRYWGRQSLSVLNINMWTGNISVVNLPFHIDCHHDNQPCLTLTDSRALLLLCMQKVSNKLDIWEEQEEKPTKVCGSAWVCTRAVVELKELGKSENEGRELVCVFGDKCGTMLVKDTIHGVYSADLQTGIMEELVDWPPRGYIVPRETVPLEVDWPGIFSSRLDISRKKKAETHGTYPPRWEVGTEVSSRKNKRRKTKIDISN